MNEAWMSCPNPADADGERITLAHSEGGRLSRRLIRERLLTRFENETLLQLGDAARLRMPAGASAFAFTTDGYTVSPLFFPGGDIGRMAVFGTANDLAVTGAVPRWFSLAMIIEDGLPVAILDRVLDSIRSAADVAGVEIVAGDTKVVPRGAADGVFLTTSGVGRLLPGAPPGPEFLQPGDELLVSGPIGRHGAAILCAREGFDFDPPPESDCACVAEPIRALIDAGITPRAVRDATRGGVAAVLHEWMELSRGSCTIVEADIPVTDAVRGVCELLGLDPLHLANEGTFILATCPQNVAPTLDVLKRYELTRRASVIGRIVRPRRTPVSIVRIAGREVPVDDPSGAPLPRIC
jgi:hydrogenase expression/formation protein HypE